jgi:hypothetical protein
MRHAKLNGPNTFREVTDLSGDFGTTLFPNGSNVPNVLGSEHWQRAELGTASAAWTGELHGSSCE